MQRLAFSGIPALRQAGVGRVLSTSLRFCHHNTMGAGQSWSNKQEPSSKDIVDRLLHDHQLIEAHFRAMRDRTSDRDRVLSSFADLLVSHSDAEEKEVYPRIRQVAQAHGESKKDTKPTAEMQHTEAVLHLLHLMETPTSNHETWEKKLHLLGAGVAQHIEEEETTLINIARTDMSAQQRAEVGEAFGRLKAQKMQEGCGSINNVRKLVEERASLLMKLKDKVGV